MCILWKNDTPSIFPTSFYITMPKRSLSHISEKQSAIVCFDVETTGLIPTGQASLRQLPHIVQLSWIIVEAEGHRIVDHGNYIVNPGVKIPTAVTRIHGITDQIAVGQGIPIREALENSPMLRAEQIYLLRITSTLTNK